MVTMSAEVDKTQTTAITMIDDCTLAKQAMSVSQEQQQQQQTATINAIDDMTTTTATTATENILAATPTTNNQIMHTSSESSKEAMNSSNHTISKMSSSNSSSIMTALPTTPTSSNIVLNNGNIADIAMESHEMKLPQNPSTKHIEEITAAATIEQHNIKSEANADADAAIAMQNNLDNQNVTSLNDKQEPTDLNLIARNTKESNETARNLIESVKVTENTTELSNIMRAENNMAAEISTNTTSTTISTENKSINSELSHSKNTNEINNINTTTTTNTTSNKTTNNVNSNNIAYNTNINTTTTTTTVNKEKEEEQVKVKTETKSTESSYKTTIVQITTLPPTPIATPTVTPTATPTATPAVTPAVTPTATTSTATATSTIQTGQTSKTNANNINNKTSAATATNNSSNSLLPTAASSSNNNNKSNNVTSSSSGSATVAGSSSNSKSNNHSSSVHNTSQPSAHQSQTNHNRKNEDAPNILVYKKMEAVIEKMQAESTGVCVRTVKGFMTKVPSVFTGADLISWIIKNLDVEDVTEALHFAHLLASHGYIFPIDDHQLTVKNDGTFYRFQTPYFWPSNCWEPENTDYAVYLCKRTMQNKTRLELADYEAENLAKLQKMFSRKWEFIFMQAESQSKVAKKRDKLERKVLDSQERAFWDVHRPMPGCVNTTEIDIKKAYRRGCSSHGTGSAGASVAKNPIEQLSRIITLRKQKLERRTIKVSKAAEALVSYYEQYNEFDYFITSPELPNPWQTDSTEMWEAEKNSKEVPMRKVKRWAFSMRELLKDSMGREQFAKFLEKEYSYENLLFWESVQEMKALPQAEIKEAIHRIWHEYLAPDAPRAVNVDSKSVELAKEAVNSPNGLNRWCFDVAAAHVYHLMERDSYPRYLRSDMYKDYLNCSRKKIKSIPNLFGVKR